MQSAARALQHHPPRPSYSRLAKPYCRLICSKSSKEMHVWPRCELAPLALLVGCATGSWAIGTMPALGVLPLALPLLPLMHAHVCVLKHAGQLVHAAHLVLSQWHEFVDPRWVGRRRANHRWRRRRWQQRGWRGRPRRRWCCNCWRRRQLDCWRRWCSSDCWRRREIKGVAATAGKLCRRLLRRRRRGGALRSGWRRPWAKRQCKWVLWSNRRWRRRQLKRVLCAAWRRWGRCRRRGQREWVAPAAWGRLRRSGGQDV